MDDSRPQFECDLESTESGLALDLGPESDVVSTFGVKKAFLRDLNQAWYHRGVVGIGADIPAVAAHLANVISESGATRSVLVGNSVYYPSPAGSSAR